MKAEKKMCIDRKIVHTEEADLPEKQCFGNIPVATKA